MMRLSWCPFSIPGYPDWCHRQKVLKAGTLRSISPPRVSVVVVVARRPASPPYGDNSQESCPWSALIWRLSRGYSPTGGLSQANAPFIRLSHSSKVSLLPRSAWNTARARHCSRMCRRLEKSTSTSLRRSWRDSIHRSTCTQAVEHPHPHPHPQSDGPHKRH